MPGDRPNILFFRNLFLDTNGGTASGLASGRGG